jgi:chromosomal replication initiation ATPase DnaA
MTRQLPLDLPHRPGLEEEDFLEAPSNRDALAMIRLWPDWPQKMVLLTGPKGSGKSHIGAIWARRAGAGVIFARDLTLDRLPGLAAGQALALDACDEAPLRETELFHLLNLAGESGASVLMIARKKPDLWGLETRDLLSRLRRAPQVAIEAPDEAFLRAILVKLFHDRQIRVDQALVDFLSLRLERSIEAAQRMVAALDREGLARGRAVTRPLAAELLKTLPEFSGDFSTQDFLTKDFLDTDD